MAKKQLIVSALSQMPAPVKKLWGPPPILRSEDPAVYWKLGLAMAEAVQPADSIEWMYLKDVVDYTWEIRRLRKYQVQLIVLQEETFLSEARKVLPPKEMQRWNELIATGQCETEMFLKGLESFESINRLLDVAESRRTAALNEIASYRKIFTPGLRKASDDFIEGEFTEHAPGPGAAGGAPASKAANGRDPSGANGSVPATKAADGRSAGDGLVAEDSADAGSLAAGSEDAKKADNDSRPGAAAGGAAVAGTVGNPGSGAGGDRVRKHPMIRRAARSHEHLAADRGEPGQRSIEHRPADGAGQGARLPQRAPPRLERLGRLRSPAVQAGRGTRAPPRGRNRKPRSARDGPQVRRSADRP
jgi:hypothetical protein